MKNGSLGARMKEYENVSRIYLTKRSPVVIRIDGRAFHSLTKGLIKPFDRLFMTAMQETAKDLCAEITGCKLAYVQSDEISLLLVDYDTINTQPWFDNNLQKLVSVSASVATLSFNKNFGELAGKLAPSADTGITDAYIKTVSSKLNKATFDSRAFVLPKDEINNYFIWRQQDATRNSILSIAQSFFAHKQIHGLGCDELQEKLFAERGVNWNDYPVPQKRGTCIVKTEVIKNGAVRRKWTVDDNIPIFTKDDEYIIKHL